jgi:hypothetical protein
MAELTIEEIKAADGLRARVAEQTGLDMHDDRVYALAGALATGDDAELAQIRASHPGLADGVLSDARTSPETYGMILAELETMNPHYAGSELLRSAARVHADIAATRDAVVMLGGPAASHALSLNRTPPDNLDDAGVAIFTAAMDRVVTGDDFYTALATETGNPDLVRFGDVPGTRTSAEQFASLPGVDPASAERDTRARDLMGQEAIGYLDAVGLVDLDRELAAVEANDGASDLPWHDLRPLSTPAVPYSDEDWARDSRRARRAGLQLTRATWQANVEEGRDLPSEHFTAQRQQRLEQLRMERDRALASAKASEAARRTMAIDTELRRRANQRAAAN